MTSNSVTRFLTVLLPALFLVFFLASSTGQPALCEPQSRRFIPIGTIQGPWTEKSSPSPMLNETVVVRAVVTALALEIADGRPRRGFFIQNRPQDADGDPNTSDGVFVGTMNSTTIPGGPDGAYTPSVGDELELQGIVNESYGMTLIARARVVMKVTEHPDITKVLEISPAAPPDDCAESVAWWEAHEGMLVSVPAGSVAVSSRKWGEVWLVNPDHPVATRESPYERRVFRDAHPLDNVTDKLFDDTNGYRYALGSLVLKGTTNEPLVEIPPVRTFCTLEAPVHGPVWFGYGRYSIQTTLQPSFKEGVQPSANGAPAKHEPGGEFSIVSFNLENLYDIRDNPSSPCDALTDEGTRSVRPPFNYIPASEEEYAARRKAFARQIINHLHSPDIIMVQEAENQDICKYEGEAFVNTGTNKADGMLDTLQELCADIAALGGPRYLPAGDPDGGDERGIICAFLYRTDRAALVPPTKLPLLGSEGFEFSQGRVFQNDTEENPKAFNGKAATFTSLFDRGPVAVCFDLRRADAGDPVARVYLVNAHFKSGPADNIERRRLQAAFTSEMVKAVLAKDPEAVVIAGGDLNVQPRPDDPVAPGEDGHPSDQLAALYEAGLWNVYEELLRTSPASAYSYVYAGQAQTLDQMFLSPQARKLFARAAVAHINSDYTSLPDFSDNYAASDHDPLVSVFKFLK